MTLCSLENTAYRRLRLSCFIQLQDVAGGSPETSVHVYQTTRCHIPEDTILLPALQSSLDLGPVELLGNFAAFGRGVSGVTFNISLIKKRKFLISAVRHILKEG